MSSSVALQMCDSVTEIAAYRMKMERPVSNVPFFVLTSTEERSTNTVHLLSLAKKLEKWFGGVK